MDALPIDPLLPEIVTRLREGNALVLEAPPGAGKTTRVPRALLDAGLLEKGECLVLEPRRLAARLAARRVAEELGETPGKTVGYQVRFEDVSSAATRIRFLTEGVLTRRLLSNPRLDGVSAVLLDEFHERHLQGDLGLALLRRLQATARPDLRLCVMSATLDAAPVAAYLGAPSIRAEGRRFEVALEHLERPDERPLAQQVASAVRRLVQAGLDGDVLVFLPGAGEIRKCIESCQPVAESASLVLLPLHGELSPDEQDRAIRPNSRRKVILSTNVAETSVTIDGVVAVIDSGLARVALHSPWSGFATLKVGKISRASATQRAGRAGRTRPGQCVRLYTKGDFELRPAHDEPEVRRLDLTPAALEIRAAGARPSEIPWFEAPSRQRLEAADNLLVQLGALTADVLTPVGRKMANLPVHPRLARLVVEAQARGAAKEGCLLAALLGERDVRDRGGFGGDRRQARTAVESDAVELLEAVLAAESRGSSPETLRREGLDIGAMRAVDRARKQLERQVGAGPTRLNWKDTDRALRVALLAAFPDRVAKRRSEKTKDLVFAAGGSAVLSEISGVHAATLVVAVDAEERRSDGAGRGGGLAVKSASAIEEDWLLDLFPDALTDRLEVTWNDSLERAEATSRMMFGAIVLDERPAPGEVAALSTKLLAQARAAGVRAFADAQEVDRLLSRVMFAATTFAESGIAKPDAGVIDAALAKLCEGRRSFAELREASILEAVREVVGGGHKLETLAPETIQLPGGRRLRVEYERDKPPWVASRLQDFFGLRQGPSLGGRVPVVLQLNAPNQRAVQVTTDLAGFWERHYPALRRELMRKYPRHAWPEDPLNATPPVPGERRR